MQLPILSMCILLIYKTVCGMHISFERNYDGRPVSLKPQVIEKSHEALFSSNDSSEIYDASTHRTDESNKTYSQIFTNDNTSLRDEDNSSVSSSNQSLSSTYSTSSVPSASSIHSMETLTSIFNNESHSQSSAGFSSSESSVSTSIGTMSGTKSTMTGPSNNATISTTDDDEPEGVARGKPSTTESVSTTTTEPKTFYERTLASIGNPYTLSILIPVVAGIVFATAIIATVAVCKNARRFCLSRRLRRKKLPDSVKDLRPSDRARLLAESSDEEF